MRLIDADALKDRAFGKRGGLIHTSDIDEMPTLEPQWIPCSERLPSEGGIYLTTIKDYSGYWVDVTDWNDGMWGCVYDEECHEINNVVAWMSLPKPYSEEKKA